MLLPLLLLLRNPTLLLLQPAVDVKVSVGPRKESGLLELSELPEPDVLNITQLI